jgi:hypothetical protein
MLKLEDQIAPFNLFEAVGIASAEIRHSNFLAYILDPMEHGGFPQAWPSEWLK